LLVRPKERKKWRRRQRRHEGEEAMASIWE
jgi:hypothetical protein